MDENNNKEPTELDPISKLISNIEVTLLKNAEDLLNLQTDAGLSRSSFPLKELFEKLIPKILRNLGILHFVGIQPMNAPVGTMYQLQYKQKNTNELSLNVINQAIQAQSRKLGAVFTIAGERELSELTETEYMDTLANEIAEEIYIEFRRDMQNLGMKKTITLRKGFLEELINTIMLTIHKSANDIALKTRRGAGNFVIVSPNIARVLEKSSSFNKHKSPKYDYKYLKNIGSYNDIINVFEDKNLEYNKCIVGYKGQNETDTGLYYCPYQLIMSTGIVINPQTFEPVVTFMTRYGKSHQPSRVEKYVKEDGTRVTEEYPCGYYEEITFENIPILKDSKEDSSKIVVEDLIEKPVKLGITPTKLTAKEIDEKLSKIRAESIDFSFEDSLRVIKKD